MVKAFAQLAFTPSVRTLQVRDGSAEAYGRVMNAKSDSGYRLTARETAFLQARDGFVQATTSETGWPYVQFRGGPRLSQGHRPANLELRRLPWQPATPEASGLPPPRSPR